MAINYGLLGRRIKRTRCKRGLAQAELAEEVDVSVPYISQIETAKKHVSLDLILLISEALSVPVDYLLTGRRVKSNYENRYECAAVLNDWSEYESSMTHFTTLQCCNLGEF